MQRSSKTPSLSTCYLNASNYNAKFLLTTLVGKHFVVQIPILVYAVLVPLYSCKTLCSMVVSVPPIAAPLDPTEYVARTLWVVAVAPTRTASTHRTNAVPKTRRLVAAIIAGQPAPYAVTMGKALVLVTTAVVVTIAVAQMRFAAVIQPCLHAATRERLAAV